VNKPTDSFLLVIIESDALELRRHVNLWHTSELVASQFLKHDIQVSLKLGLGAMVIGVVPILAIEIEHVEISGKIVYTRHSRRKNWTSCIAATAKIPMLHPNLVHFSSNNACR
jgi:hypothetical protein